MVSGINRQNLPDIDRLSILAAMIVLAYTLDRFIDLPSWEISRQFPGLYIEFTISISLIISVLSALMTAAGVIWLMQDHPASTGQAAIQHAILPALTALVIGITLGEIPVGLGWWIGLIASAGILMLVIIAEYIAVDTNDIRLPIANASLSAVSFALFLVLAGALRDGGMRLLFSVPILIIAAWLVSLRVTNLRLHGVWTVYESAIIAFVVGQIAAAFNYWPLSPITFSLLLLGPSYALISLFCNLIEEKPARQLVVEPIVSMAIAWGAAFIFR
jgi:hypothetical protein